MAFATNNKAMNIIVATLFLSSLACMGANADATGEGENKVYVTPSNEKVRVKITNTLGGGVWLGLHCRSKNDDLGFKTLPPNKSFGFAFQPNFWGTTLFHCHVTWEWPGSKQSRFFDAFKFSRDHNRCPRGGECCWNITPQGPCSCVSKRCFPWK